ncbi:hypothetical protein ACNAUY_13730 [Acinetobacter tibetensis]|uniref:hypothetical protein n=1 Tax=Acinetobacter tibetensis TaxID=2943497 RepID=UPI003A4E0EA8
MDSKSIRYQNTRLLVKSVGGVSNFAEKIGKGQSQTSQFAGTNPIKGIGNKVAREIEDIFDKPHGWLDVPHTNINDISTTIPTSQYEISEDRKVENKELQQLINILEDLDAKGKLSSQLVSILRDIVDLAK